MSLTGDLTGDQTGELIVGRPVVIAVDPQQGSGQPGGGIPAAMDGKAQRAARMVHIVDRSRELGVPVVFIQEVHKRSMIDIGRELDGAEGPHCIEDDPHNDFIEGITPRPEEFHIRKRRYSAFFGTELELVLKAYRAQTLILFGGLTDVCVHYTAVDAHQHDYHVRVVTDAVGGSSQPAHDAALAAIAYLQRDALVRTDDLLDALELWSRGMTLGQVLIVLAAGGVAGAINAIVGSGSLVTFPVLLAVGLPSVTANVSNTIGLAPGNASAVWGYRRELAGQARRCAVFGVGTALGAATGATLLLVLPAGVFKAVVPVLILLACGLMALRPSPALTTAALTSRRAAIVTGIACLVGIYGGYFGAAQGVILLASLRLLISDRLQRLNGLKNVLVGTANGVAAIQFAIFAHVRWEAAGLIAVGSVAGAQLGSRYGRRLSDALLRRAVIGIGVAVAIVLIIT